MRLFYTVFELESYLSKVTYLNLTHLHFAPLLGGPIQISPKPLIPGNQSLGYDVELFA